MKGWEKAFFAACPHVDPKEIKRLAGSRLLLDTPRVARERVVKRPKYVIAATEYVYGEFVVCEGDAGGPIRARFPRTKEGYAAALAFIGSVS